MSGSVDVACVGILVADVIARPVEELPERGTLALVEEITLRGGGCAVNAASVLARLGLAASVAGKVGADPFGAFLLRLLDEREVERGAVLEDERLATSATVVLVAPDGERTFLHLPGANAGLRLEELERTAVLGARALHLAGSLVMPELDGDPSAQLLSEAKERGLVTSLDTVWDATGRWQRVLPCLPHVDLFAPNLAEARAISREHEPARVAAWLREQGVGEVAVTMGGEGCYASGEGLEGWIPPLAVEPVDGTGSGDAFSAGLLYGKLAGWTFEESARFANAAGALATTATGAVEGVRDLTHTLAFAGLKAAAS
ncbi:MAG: carbohydrate kinase family protein [Actinomycetota bacterium]|nr:carbohydrate kinase family protein [Actinomycetota bacterium]